MLLFGNHMHHQSMKNYFQVQLWWMQIEPCWVVILIKKKGVGRQEGGRRHNELEIKTQKDQRPSLCALPTTSQHLVYTFIDESIISLLLHRMLPFTCYSMTFYFMWYNWSMKISPQFEQISLYFTRLWTSR